MFPENLPRVRRRFASILLLAVGVVALACAPAQAHVRVLSYQPAVQGGYTVLTFRVPTEEDSPTIGLQVTLPADTPFASVSVMPKAGWTVALEKSTLKTPIKSDDGDVTDVVSPITWTAAAGGGIPVDGYDEFNISVGPLPTASSLSFPAIQTYANGDVVRWIEPTPANGSEPDHPVPTLSLAAAGSPTSPTATPSTGSSSADVSPTTASASDTTARGLAIGGLALGVLGIVIAGAALRARRSA